MMAMWPGVEFGLEGAREGWRPIWSLSLRVESFGDAERGAGFVIEVVGEGDDGVEAVVAAAQLEDDEDGGVGLGGDGAGGAGDERGDVGAGGDEAEALDAGGEEFAAGLEEAGVAGHGGWGVAGVCYLNLTLTYT